MSPPTRSAVVCVMLAALSVARLIAQGGAPAGSTAAQTSIAAAAPSSEERLRALQQQAEVLAGQARSLLGDLRRLELERDIQRERLRRADAAAERARRDLGTTAARLEQLEAQRIGDLPQLQRRLVEVYKRGHGGYARLLLGGSSFQEFSRATRLLASTSRRTLQQLETHRQLVTALQTERTARATSLARLEAEQAAAKAAREAADTAVRERASMLADIDHRRDLTAQLTSELDGAARRLQEQVRAVATPASIAPPAPQAAPVRGAFIWPVDGRVVGRFGEPAGRTGAAAVRNGVEISAPEGTNVRASLPGRVVFADELPGFGTVVILDHGRGVHSVYGYLATDSVKSGDQLDATAPLGRVGVTAAGSPALYFELRVDGRSVDPLQWLKPR